MANRRPSDPTQGPTFQSPGGGYVHRERGLNSAGRITMQGVPGYEGGGGGGWGGVKFKFHLYYLNKQLNLFELQSFL